MTVLVDEPRWWWRGRRWCHLVSDHDLEELHRFAADVGMPRRGFQGDHYDVPEEHRPAVVAAGAVEVPSRELVRRLRAAGLRITPAQRRAAVGGVEAVSPTASNDLVTSEPVACVSALVDGGPDR